MQCCPTQPTQDMITKKEMRQKIIEFFTTFCDNRLNKNIYSINFYKKRGKEEVYHYLRDYFKGTVLENKSVAQKYYHIFWDHVDVPDTKFRNFMTGYHKEKGTPTNKSIEWLKASLNNFIPTPNTAYPHTHETAKTSLLQHFKKVNYKSLLEETELLSFVLAEQSHLEADNYTKIVLYCQDTPLCICGACRKITGPLRLPKTCGNPACLSALHSLQANKRDLSYLQTPANKLKRVKSRSWYRPSPETKEKMSVSNKRTWTPEKKKMHVEENRTNGAFDKISKTMKRKILSGEITPRTANRLTHKRLSSPITGVTAYRSNWEVQYHEQLPHLQYESLRIPYFFSQKQHVYIVDFWDPEKREAISSVRL